MRVADVTSVDMMCSVEISDWHPKYGADRLRAWCLGGRIDCLTCVIGFEARGTILLAMRLAV